MTMCVLIGGDDLLEDRLDDTPPQAGMLRLLVDPGMLENTYQEFLGECLDYVNSSSDNPAIQAVYNKVRDASKGNTQHDVYSVGLLNRSNGESQNVGLADSVRETSTRFVYLSNQEIDSRPMEIKTLELYVIRQECGG